MYFKYIYFFLGTSSNPQINTFEIHLNEIYKCIETASQYNINVNHCV